MLCLLMLIEDEDDKKKFEQIYLTYRKRMQYVAFQILKDEQEAENMVHDTFVTLIDCLDKIDETECHKTWNYIVTILKNKCFNYLKRSRRVEYLEEDVFEVPASQLKDMETVMIREESVERLTACIRQLKYPYREVIYLQYCNDMSSREIGALLDLTEANVRQISRRAKKRLKELLADYD